MMDWKELATPNNMIRGLIGMGAVILAVSIGIAKGPIIGLSIFGSFCVIWGVIEAVRRSES